VGVSANEDYALLERSKRVTISLPKHGARKTTFSP
jgi:hypothetical protein